MINGTHGRHAAIAARGFVVGAALEARAHVRLLRRRARGAQPGGGAPVTRVDPLSGPALDHPERWHAELHASGPVHYCAPRDLFILNGYHAVRAGARAHDALISGEGVSRYRVPTPMLVTTDRPDHARLRRILARDFTKAQMDLLRPRIERVAAAGIERIHAAPQGADAYAGLAEALPLDITALILGFPTPIAPRCAVGRTPPSRRSR